MTPILVLTELLPQPKPEVRWDCVRCHVNMVNDPDELCGECQLPEVA